MAISNASSGFRAGVCTSTTRPSQPYIGQLIFETDTFAMNFWNGSAWQGAISAPAGTVNSFAGSSAPSGWLLCAGQTVSRTQYAGLFAVIGTTYGAGDGSTTFTLPDLRGRVIAGEDDMGGTAANRLTSGGAGINGTVLGAAGGAETVTLTSAQSGVPAHGHGSTGGQSQSHTHTGTTGTENYSSFGLAYLQNQSSRSFSQITANPAIWASIDGYSHTHSFTTNNANQDHTHTVNNNTAANASQAHTNTQPTIILNYIIKV